MGRSVSRTVARGGVAFLLVGLLVGSTAPVASLAASGVPRKLDPRVLTGPSPRAIVGFKHDVTNKTIRRLSRAGIRRALVFDAIDAAAIRGPERSYLAIARWKDVAWVDDDSRLSYANNQARATSGVDAVRSGQPPLDTGYTGAGVTVAVVDSGVNNLHPDLVDRIVTNVNMEPQPSLDSITDGDYSERFAEAPVGTDELGHGTHVAGTVGGSGRSGMGADMSGVATGADMMNCKLGLSRAFETSAIACYQWILDHRNDPRFDGGIRVATNSWGMFDDEASPGRPLEAILRVVVDSEITVLFAAGNDGPDPNTAWPYPNSMDEVITVGAGCKLEGSDPSYCAPRDVAYFSSRGPALDVLGPGVAVWSTKTPGFFPVLGVVLPQGDTTTPGEPDPASMANNQVWYTPASGTSMATPHVAGIVALMLEANPGLTPAQVADILRSTAIDRAAPGFDEDTGWGFVDALAAVAAAEDAP